MLQKWLQQVPALLPCLMLSYATEKNNSYISMVYIKKKLFSIHYTFPLYNFPLYRSTVALFHTVFFEGLRPWSSSYLGHCQCCGSREKRIRWEHMRVPKAPTQKGPHNTSSYMSLVTVSHMAYSEVNGTGKYKCTICKLTEASLPQHSKISIEITLIRGAKFPCSIVEPITGARGTESSDWFSLDHMIQP